jgi:hypothetical protein
MQKIIVILNSNTNRKSAKKNIRFEHELLADIEAVKPKDVSFSEWVKSACRDKIAHIQNHYMVSAHSVLNEQVDVTTPLSTFGCTHALEPSVEALIREWHSQGLFAQQIADKLNHMGKLTPDRKQWSRLLVRQMINNS